MMNVEKNTKNFHQGEASSKDKVLRRSPSIPTPEKIVNDAIYALRISRRLLIMLGIWQWTKAEKSLWRLVLSNISVIMCYSGLAISVIPMGLYIAETRDPIGKIKLIGPWTFCLMATLKYFFLRSHRFDIETCMKHIDLDWSTIKSSCIREMMLQHARYGHLITITCAGFTYSGGFFFAMLPLLIGIMKVNDDTDDNNNITMRPLSLPSDFVFFVATETPAYEIIYAIQVLAAFMMHSVVVACYSIAVVVVMHVCGQRKILMENIDKLVDGEPEVTIRNNFNVRITDIIRDDVRTLRLISAAEKMLREICLVEISGGTLILCFSGYFILLEYKSDVPDPISVITYTLLFGSFLFNIFSFCYIGELLTGECRKVGDTVYMIDWYRLPSIISRDLCLIIIMAQKPVNLTAGGTIKFSYACFASVIKTSVGYLNMLRAVMA